MPPYQSTGRSDGVRPTPALSLDGIQWYMVDPVDADDTQFRVRARLQIEAEILWVEKVDYAAGSRDVAGPVIEVLRGREGTTAVAHDVGAEYTWLGPPEGEQAAR